MADGSTCTGPWIGLVRLWDPTERAARRSGGQGLFQGSDQEPGRHPQTTPPDFYAASRHAMREMRADGVVPGDTTLRSAKCLNNLIEQHHRNNKSRVTVTHGLKQFKNAAITIARIELMHRIRKWQFNSARVREAAAPVCWNAVLSA